MHASAKPGLYRRLCRSGWARTRGALNSHPLTSSMSARSHSWMPLMRGVHRGSSLNKRERGACLDDAREDMRGLFVHGQADQSDPVEVEGDGTVAAAQNAQHLWSADPDLHLKTDATDEFASR